MRAVNLIPPDLRRGDHAPLRTGPLAYIVVGAMAFALLGVTLLVLASNEVSDKKSEAKALQKEDELAKARAESLAPYIQFQLMSEQRVQTVTSLADSRFDWPRVMRELTLVLPGDVTLTSLDASASLSEEGEATKGVLGPSLELEGCTSSQDAVATFITSLKDIDGVTRVGLESSSSEEGGSGGEGCEGKTEFKLVVAFDAAPLIPVEGPEVAPEAEEGESSSGEGEEEAAEGG
jgi:Tfp pilus assembly protein PilN